MLKKRNLKVLAAAISMTVMSGFYANPVWAANWTDTEDDRMAPDKVIVTKGINNTGGMTTDYFSSSTIADVQKLNVSDVATFAESVSMNKGLTVAGGIAVDALEVKGPTFMYGKQTINGSQELYGDLYMTGKATIGNGLVVTGGISADAIVANNTLQANNGLTVHGGGAYITGDSVVNGKLDVNGFEADSINVNQNANIQGVLSVQGSTWLKETHVTGPLGVDGEASVSKNFAVSGQTYLKHTSINGNMTVDNGLLTATGGANITNGLTADTANISGEATVGKLKVAGGEAYIDDKGNIATNGELKVAGGKAYIDDKGAMKLASGNFAVDSNGNVATVGSLTAADKKFVVDGSTGNIKTAGSLSVGSGNLAVDEQGNLKTNGTIGAAGGNFAVKEDGSIVTNKNLEVKQNATVGGTLEVTGATTLNDRLDVARGATFANQKVTIEDTGRTTFEGSESGKTVINGGKMYVEDRVQVGDYFVVNSDAKRALFGATTGDQTKIENGNIIADGEVKAKTYANQSGTFAVDENGNTKISDASGNYTELTSTDVSITDPVNSDNRINLSDLGQIDDVDQELQGRSEYDETAVGAINAEAAIRREEVARLDNRIDKVEDRLDKVGAMTAAIANLRTMGYDPCAPTEFSMSLGHYRGETGMALGFFHYPNRDFMLSFSVSTAGDEYMGGIGATWKFGRKTPEQLAEEIKAKEAKKALAKAEAERKAAMAVKVKAQQAKHAEMQ